MGLIDSLEKHRKIGFNPKYRMLGMLGYPFWFIFEWLAPILAAMGIVYTIFLAIVGAINWQFFLLITGFIYSFSVFLSAFTVLFEEVRRTDSISRMASQRVVQLVSDGMFISESGCSLPLTRFSQTPMSCLLAMTVMSLASPWHTTAHTSSFVEIPEKTRE